MLFERDVGTIESRTAATVHAVRAPGRNYWIRYRISAVPLVPIMRPLKQVPVQVKQPATTRTKLFGWMDLLAAVLHEPTKPVQ